MVYQPWMICPFSGATENISRVKLIPIDFADDADANDMQVACMEWVWGLRRGELSYHLAKMHNSLFMRKDIAQLYATYQFILAPTFKTYLDVMEFLTRTGVKHRADKDKSPRRPLTALTPPTGRYRYVFIPMTDAARELQAKLNLQRQTKEDLAGWLHPLFNLPIMEGTEDYPVVECFCHPYSLCTLATHAFDYYEVGSTLNSQWSTCAQFIINQWRISITHVPQWFIDAPDMEDDDITVTGAEAEGYSIPSLSQASAERRRVVYDDEEIVQAKVSSWVGDVDPNSVPEEQPPVPRSPLQLRRSERLKNKAHPYGSSSMHTPLSPVRKAPRPLPSDSDPVAAPPAWAKRSGWFRTRQFSSNDWAYFHHNVGLAAPTRHRSRYLRRP
ncbi:hypothetical protein HDZ31DRAFT_40932 [Schizophyllum fasciatum]